MKERIIFGTLASIIVALIFIFPFKPIVAALLLTLSIIASFEYLQLLKQKKLFPSKYIFIVGSALTILFFYLKWPLALLLISLLFLTFILGYEKKIENSSTRIAFALLGLIYIVLPMGMLLFLFSKSLYWTLYLIVVSKASDIGGYFGGSLFGKRSFAPKISPKKTWEGAVFGVVSSLIAAFLFSFLLGPKALWLGFILAPLAELGDLSESLLKRDCLVKDSGIVPGLGGVLDMIDSLIFNIFIIYAII